MTEQKKSLVAIHGAGMHGAVWDVLHELQCQGQAISLPGHKQGSGACLPTIEKMAGWVRGELDQLPQKSITLMGHSMGALVALEAATHPAVASLILVGAAAAMPVHPDLLRTTEENPEAAMDLILKWGVSADHADAAAVKTLLKGHMLSVMPGALANDLKACDAYKQGAAAARSIKKPTLVLSATDDKMTRATDGKALADLISGATYKALPDCGHMMIAERPADVTREITEFMKVA